MKDRIIEMLERGERVELECVHGNAIATSYAEALSGNQAVVSHLLDDKIIFENSFFIYESELEHFKIKETEYTFNNLIDVAVQAVRDEVLSRYIYYTKGNGGEVIALYVGEDLKMQFFTGEEKRGIERIKSLYTETFVIEREEDEMKIRQPVKSIILANGEEIINEDRLSLLQKGLCLKAGAAGNIKIPFSLLKGATVTQKRGERK